MCNTSVYTKYGRWPSADVLGGKIAFVAAPGGHELVIWRHMRVVDYVRPIDGVHGLLPVIHTQWEVLVEQVGTLPGIRDGRAVRGRWLVEGGLPGSIRRVRHGDHGIEHRHGVRGRAVGAGARRRGGRHLLHLGERKGRGIGAGPLRSGRRRHVIDTILTRFEQRTLGLGGLRGCFEVIFHQGQVDRRRGGLADATWAGASGARLRVCRAPVREAGMRERRRGPRGGRGNLRPVGKGRGLGRGRRRWWDAGRVKGEDGRHVRGRLGRLRVLRGARGALAAGDGVLAGGLLLILPRGGGAPTQRQVLARLEIARTAAAHDHGPGVRFADGDLRAGGERGDDLEADDEMLLEFLAAAIVGGRDAELQSLPRDREGCELGVHVLAIRHQVEVDGRRFLLGLVLGPGDGGTVHGGRGLPRDGDDLDRVPLDGLGGGHDQFLGQDRDAVAVIRHDVAHAAGQGDGAGDLEEVAAIAGQLGHLRRHVGGRVGPGRLGQEEHAMQLRRDGNGGAAEGVVEQGEAVHGHGEGQELVVVVDGLGGLLLGGHRVEGGRAQEVGGGKGVLVGRKASERGHVGMGEGQFFTTIETISDRFT
jgi:hypothetical protein